MRLTVPPLTVKNKWIDLMLHPLNALCNLLAHV